jgi:hypothetical protein
MIESIGRRLRVAFDRSGSGDELADPPGAAVAPPHPEVEFVAYGEDCILSGRVRLAADRLSDMLNEHDEYLLVDVLVERLDETGAVEVKEVLVKRDEILLVHATGPRGSLDRRHRTRLHPVALQLGPYRVHGYLHARPGSDPLYTIRHRQPMVPLTEASIEYDIAGSREHRRVGTVVVNRDLMDWVLPALEDEIEVEVEVPDMPMTAEQGPLLKDFTGNLFAEPAEFETA